jgi:hypothetical protein
MMGDQKLVHDYLFFELGFARGVMTKDWKYIQEMKLDIIHQRDQLGDTHEGDAEILEIISNHWND